MMKISHLLLFPFIALCLLAADLEGGDRAVRRQERPRLDAQVDLGRLTLSGSRGSGSLDRYIESSMNTKHLPGLSAAAIKHGKIIWTGAFGLAHINPPAPVEEKTLFMLASISKTLTCSALMELHDQDLFELDDPINNYLPFNVVHPVHSQVEITFQMLLTHTSSIKDNWAVMPYYPGDSPIPLSVYLPEYLVPGGTLYNANLNFSTSVPGTKYDYCNIAVALAGYLVEVLSGIPLEDFSQQNLFGPLHMNETSYFLANLNPSHVAMPCYWSGGSYHQIGHFGYSDYPSGAVRTSATQLITFLSLFWENHDMLTPPGVAGMGNTGNDTGIAADPASWGLDGSGAFSAVNRPEFVRFLQPDTANLMTTVQDPVLDPGGGLIWYKWNLNNRLLWGHNGGDQGVSTEMWYCPAEDTGVVVLTNGEAYFSNIVHAIFEFAAGQ